MTERLKNLGILLLFLLGTAIFLYPTLSSQWNAYRDRQLLSTYHKQVTQKKPSEMEEVWQKAKAYNARLGIQPVQMFFHLGMAFMTKITKAYFKLKTMILWDMLKCPLLK